MNIIFKNHKKCNVCPFFFSMFETPGVIKCHTNLFFQIGKLIGHHFWCIFFLWGTLTGGTGWRCQAISLCFVHWMMSHRTNRWFLNNLLITRFENLLLVWTNICVWQNHKLYYFNLQGSHRGQHYIHHGLIDIQAGSFNLKHSLQRAKYWRKKYK